MVIPQRRIPAPHIPTLALTLTLVAEYLYFVYTAFANCIVVQNVFFAHHLGVPDATAFAIQICAVTSTPSTILLLPLAYSILNMVQARVQGKRKSNALPIAAIALLTAALVFVKVAFTLPH